MSQHAPRSQQRSQSVLTDPRRERECQDEKGHKPPTGRAKSLVERIDTRSVKKTQRLWKTGEGRHQHTPSPDQIRTPSQRLRIRQITKTCEDMKRKGAYRKKKSRHQKKGPCHDAGVTMGSVVGRVVGTGGQPLLQLVIMVD